MSIKTKFAVAAIVAAGAVAVPSVASAAQWQANGSTISTTRNVVGGGTLTLTLVANPAVKTTCASVGVEGTIRNSSGSALGSISTLDLQDCTTTVPGCDATAVSNIPPNFDLTGNAGSTVTIGNNLGTGGQVSFTNRYLDKTPGSCSLNGVAATFTGQITGSLASSTVTFTSAAGLSNPSLGPATVSGTVDLETDTAEAISLI